MALATASTVALLATSSYSYITREWKGQGQRLSTQQSLRSAIDLLTRQLRLSGACLPTAGPADGSIRALSGTDNGTTDTITVRSNVRCAIGTAQDPVNAGASEITNMDTVEDFVAGMWAYILHADTTSGEYFLVQNVNQGQRRLRVDASTPIIGTYPINSTVYGAEPQAFGIDSGGTVPVLTLTPTAGSPEPAVAGIERLNIRYVLNRPQNCDPAAGACDVVDLPTASEWAIVRMVEIDIGARSSRQVTGGGINGFYQLTKVIRVKPRNLLF